MRYSINFFIFHPEKPYKQQIEADKDEKALLKYSEYSVMFQIVRSCEVNNINLQSPLFTSTHVCANISLSTEEKHLHL